MKVYFNKTIIKKTERIPFLNPILWIYEWKFSDNAWSYSENQKLERAEKWKDLLKFSSIKECDYVIFPKWYYIDSYAELRKEAEYAEKYWKKIIVFYHSDNESPININNTIIFRSSLSQNSPSSEFCYPPIIEPIREKKYYNFNPGNISIWYTWYYNESSLLLEILNKLRNTYFFQKIFVPICLKLTFFVKNSFCINPEQKKDTLYYILSQSWKWRLIRSNVINVLKKSQFKFKLTKRESMLSPEIKWKLRDEYIKNIYSCTFPLVIRWDGNYSYRLYEVMSAWKIPLFIDTDCRLPFEEEIDYKNLFIRIPYNDLENIDWYIKKYLKYNKNLNIIENKIRNTYNDYIYFPHWCEKIIDMLTEI